MSSRHPPITLRPSVLTWARERAGLRVDELARKVNVKTERVQAWERYGSISMPQAERLARAAHVPLGYLFLSRPPDESLPIPDFRVRGDTPPSHPSPDLLETVYAMQRRQMWMRDELVENWAEPLVFIGAYSPNGNASMVAGAMRDALGLVDQWAASEATWSNALRLLRDRVENAGVLVFFNGVVGNNTSRKLDPEEFQGFALVDEYAPLIFVNNADFKAAQMFTLAHELAHLLIGESGVSGFSNMEPAPNATEQFCDQAAAEFLVSEDDLRAFWPSAKQSGEPFRTVARHFKVSAIVAARRALDLEMIDRGTFFRFYNEYKTQSSFSPRASDGGDFWNTQRWRIGSRFAATVIRAVNSGRLSYTEAYSLTDLGGDNFEKLSERMGFRP